MAGYVMCGRRIQQSPSSGITTRARQLPRAFNNLARQYLVAGQNLVDEVPTGSRPHLGFPR